MEVYALLKQFSLDFVHRVFFMEYYVSEAGCNSVFAKAFSLVHPLYRAVLSHGTP